MVILFYLTSPQGQGHHNSVGQLLWTRVTYPSLSTIPVWGETGVPGENPRLSAERWLLFSHEDWVWVHIKMNLLGIELGISEVTQSPISLLSKETKEKKNAKLKQALHIRY